MAPNCAVADVTRDGALIMCSAQAIYLIARRSRALARPPGRKDPRAVLRGLEHVRRQLLHRCGEAAAIMSQELGRPVRLQLSRQDEFGWDNYGPAHLAEIRGAVDANGKTGRRWGVPRRRDAPQVLTWVPSAWHGVGKRVAAQVGVTRRRRAAAGGFGGSRRGAVTRPGGGGLYQVRIFAESTCTTFRTGGLLEHRVAGRGYLKSGPCARRWIRRISSRRKG